MLTYPLIHPELLAALSRAGHGSAVLLADANYAHGTGTNPSATTVHLGLAPGVLDVEQVLRAVVGAVPFESAVVMSPDDGASSPVAAGYGAVLGRGVPLAALPRADFKQACLSPDLAVVVTTGEQRHYANLLLTVGALPPG
ncbi:MAG: RbsD/FucU domain-containing protein [Phycicoccus sp.]